MNENAHPNRNLPPTAIAIDYPMIPGFAGNRVKLSAAGEVR